MDANHLEPLDQQIQALQQENKELFISELNFRRMVEQATDLISRHTPDGIYLYASAACFDLLGYLSNELVGHSAYDFFHPDDLAAGLESHETILASQESYRANYRIRCKDGSHIWFETTSRAIRDPQTGEVLEIIASSRDISDTKRAQAALDDLLETLQKRTADLHVLNEELTTFTYITSHDLRAPLVNLKGFSSELGLTLETIQTLVEPALSHLPDDQQKKVRQSLFTDAPEYLKYIGSSVIRIDGLTAAILKLSRMGRRELLLEDIDVEALVAQLLNTLGHQIKQQRAKVIVQKLPPVVADRTALEQIFSNILANAVNYLDPSRPGEITISAEQDSEKTTFQIRDNGRGIAPEDMHKVFEPFRRAVQDVPGEGMGLAYVQAMVRRLGGQISCDSMLGVGTTFTVTITHGNLLEIP